MRVVITGAAGFLGTRVVELLVEAGHDVRAVGDVPDHVEFGDEVTVVRGDLRDPDLAERAVAGAEVVCHLAGCHPGELASDQFPAVIAELDVPTGVILHALAATGFEGRIVLGSNAEVYGEGRYDCALHGSLRIGRRAAADLAARQWEPACPHCHGAVTPLMIDESAMAAPLTAFAASKLHQEHLVDCFTSERDLVGTSLRLQNVYGSDVPVGPTAAGVYALFRRDLSAGRRPRVPEDGSQRRDFLHVDDAARAVMLAITHPTGHHGPVNISSGKATTLLELATAMCVTQDARLWPEVVGTSRPGEARHLVAAPTLAESVLGFRSEISLADGLSRSVAPSRRS